MVQRRAAWFVKGDFDRTSIVTTMLTDLRRNTLQERRMQSKSVMLYRIVHNLVEITAMPFLIPLRTSRGHSMKFFIPQSTVNSHLYSFFPSTIRMWNQLPEYAISATYQLRDLQAATAVQHLLSTPRMMFLACN